MSRSSLILMTLFGLAGCVTSSADPSSGSSSRKGPEYAWDMAVCDTPQASGHCNLRDGGSQTDVDMSDNAFFVTVRSIGRGDVPVVIRLHKQARNTFDGSAVGTSGRRIVSSPIYHFDADTTVITHKFEFSDGVLHDGLSYMVVAMSGEEELYATITATGNKDPVEAGGGGLEVPDDEAPSDL